MNTSNILNAASTLLLIILISGCGKYSDYDDYETRIEYYKNIRPTEILTSNELTVVTWNIQLAFAPADGNPWNETSVGGKIEHLNELSELLLSLSPDIVLLQEVPLDRENTVVKKVLDRLALKMNYNFAFGGHGFNSDGSYPTRAQWGNAILSKFPIDQIENREVINLNDIWSRRSVLKTRLKIGDGEYLNAYSLHYFVGVISTDSFLSQVEKTKDFYVEENLPTIVGGDFNISRDFTDTILNLTNCEPLSLYSIDRIYVSNDFTVSEFYQENQESIELSDHFAGIVKVEIN